MKRITDRTVELEGDELAASERFDELLDEGYGIEDAIIKASEEFSGLSLEFWDWQR